MEWQLKCIGTSFYKIIIILIFIKYFRGGKICLDIHFAPIWQKNSPKFGIAHALALGLGPWLAVEIPMLIEEGKITKKWWTVYCNFK